MDRNWSRAAVLLRVRIGRRPVGAVAGRERRSHGGGDSPTADVGSIAEPILSLSPIPHTHALTTKTQMRYVPSFNDFNSNVSVPMPVHRSHAEGAAAAPTALRRSSAPAAVPAAAAAVGPVDMAEGESAAAGKGPRSPAQVFAESLYENMRQT